MTTRQWKLYNLLSANPDKWFSEKEITEQVEGYEYIENPTHSTTHCATIFADKNEINANLEVDGIIVMKKHLFKRASYEEYIEERNAHIRALKKQKEYIDNLDRKNARNNNGKLLNNQLGELKEENKQFIETYLTETK